MPQTSDRGQLGSLCKMADLVPFEHLCPGKQAKQGYRGVKGSTGVTSWKGRESFHLPWDH